MCQVILANFRHSGKMFFADCKMPQIQKVFRRAPRETRAARRQRQEEIMRQCMDAEKLRRRMNKVIGQLNAINKMVDEDVPCEDILMQINAAKSALHKVGQLVLEGHLHHCVRDGIEHGDADKTISEFSKAVEHFSRMS